MMVVRLAAVMMLMTGGADATAAQAAPDVAPTAPGARQASPQAVKAGEPAAAADIRTTLSQRFPGVQVDAVRPAPLPGLYEVYIRSEIVYVDAKAEYLLSGKLLTTADKRNLTAERWNEFNRIDFGKLPLDAAIKTVRGKGTRRLVVFSDPLCPFCRKLEHELANMDDVTLYTFLFPLEDLHKGATARARSIWCSSDRAEAWRAWMMESKEPAAAECALDPVAGNQSLGEKLNVTSTPTLFFSDGSRATGAIAAAEIDKLLKQRSGIAAVAATKN